jgi:hypothetical protein
MKSAYELAMSRLEKSSPVRKLSDAKKTALAEIDSEIDAKIAERKIFLEPKIAQAAGDSEGQAQLRRELASDIANLEEKREKKKNAVREGA